MFPGPSCVHSGKGKFTHISVVTTFSAHFTYWVIDGGPTAAAASGEPGSSENQPSLEHSPGSLNCLCLLLMERVGGIFRAAYHICLLRHSGQIKGAQTEESASWYQAICPSTFQYYLVIPDRVFGCDSQQDAFKSCYIETMEGRRTAFPKTVRRRRRVSKTLTGSFLQGGLPVSSSQFPALASLCLVSA